MIFSQFLDIMSLPPGSQIQKWIWLKCCTLIDFMICHKFAIHCACKLWTGMMIFRFFSIFWHRCPLVIKYRNQYYWNAVPWYISWFATILQFIVYVNYEQKQWYYDFFPKSSNFRKQRWPPVSHLQPDQPNFLCTARFYDLPQVFNSLCM